MAYASYDKRHVYQRKEVIVFMLHNKAKVSFICTHLKASFGRMRTSHAVNYHVLVVGIGTAASQMENWHEFAKVSAP